MKYEAIDGVTTYPDGREVCSRSNFKGRAEYRRRIRKMWQRQKGLCCLCQLPLSGQYATFEHQDGRGMGGSHQDDRIERDGKLYNGAAHLTCNTEKGSRRINYNITEEQP